MMSNVKVSSNIQFDDPNILKLGFALAIRGLLNLNSGNP